MKIVEFIEAFAKLNSKYHQFILEHGTHYTVENFAADAGQFSFLVPEALPQACYRNAALLHISCGVAYHEGFYLTEGIPLALEHAFNVQEGKVYDITASAFKHLQVIEWYGVEVPDQYVKEAMIGNNPLTPLQLYYRKEFHNKY